MEGTENSSHEHKEPPYGKRLFVDIVDDVARNEPARPYIFEPRSANLSEGWKAITYEEVANGINHIAHELTNKHGAPQPGAFPTVAYIGLSDVRYVMFVLGSIKAGYQTLLISPRNSKEGQLNLFNKTDCSIVWHAALFTKNVESWLHERSMTAVTMPETETLVNTKSTPFPYNKSFEEAEWDPLAVLHTSGSTGFPIPIVSRQGMWAIGDKLRQLPDLEGAEIGVKAWARCERMYLVFPPFHMAGLFALLIISIYYRAPMALGLPDRPPSVDGALQAIKYAGVDGVAMPPSVVEDLSAMEEGVTALAKLKIVASGGAILAFEAATRLQQGGVKLNNAFGSTEWGVYPFYFQPDTRLWRYIIYSDKSDLFPWEWRPVQDIDGIFELVAARESIGHPGWMGIWYTFPDALEWSTKDLYKPHPTLPGHWAYYGRNDDIIVFSNGEKLNPVTIEGTVTGHAGVKGAIVVGHGKLQAALIVEPSSTPESAEDSIQFLDDIWPLVQRANKETVAHGQISRDLVVLSNPNKPFMRASKGTIQRQMTVNLYADELKAIYDRTAARITIETVQLDMKSEDTLMVSLRSIFLKRFGTYPLDFDGDFFAAGIDSLQVINLARMLRSSLPTRHIEPRTIYANPTVRRLATYLLSSPQTGVVGKSDRAEQEIEVMKQLLEKYTSHLLPQDDEKPDPSDEEQTILLTGTTGSLGTYLLDQLTAAPNVRMVIALNRSPRAAERQFHLNQERGLSTCFEKVKFFVGDYSLPDLGLGKSRLSFLTRWIDRIIHNAWPVNFHYGVESFESSIAGVRYLADLSIAARKNVPIVFVSSRAAVDGLQGTVAEGKVDDFTMPVLGYGRSKLLGSLILDEAREKSGVPSTTIRLGQIAGPRGEKGLWNPQEFLPSLIASSLYLNALPSDLGAAEIVDWIPVEDMARLVLDVAGVTIQVQLGEIEGYFHGVNPQKTRWAKLAPTVMGVYRKRIKKTVSLEEWIGILEASAVSTEDFSKHPALKLVDTYKAFLDAGKAGRINAVLGMERAVARSSTIQSLEAVSPELMKHWCQQWQI